MKENIEKLFQEDIREKKKTSSGAFHMRGKGVRHGFNSALRTPSYFMKPKERNALNGAVETSNMYSTILNWDEWIQKDKETQKTLMTKWREIYSNTQICEQLQIGRFKDFNAQSFADIINELGCPKKTHQVHNKNKDKKPRKTKNAAIISSTPTVKDHTPTLIELADSLEKAITPKQLSFEEPKQEVKQVLITNGLHLEYNGEYDCEQLSKIFTKLQLLTDGEPHKFKISLSLTECEK